MASSSEKKPLDEFWNSIVPFIDYMRGVDAGHVVSSTSQRAIPPLDFPILSRKPPDRTGASRRNGTGHSPDAASGDRSRRELSEMVRIIKKTSFASIEKKIPRVGRGKNLLHRWMFDDTLDSIKHYEMRVSQWGEARKLDVKEMYRRYCTHRSMPPDQVVKSAVAVGVALALNYEHVRVSYVSLFFPGWGQWICPVDPLLDPDGVERNSLIGIVDILGYCGIPLVCVGEEIAELFMWVLIPFPIDSIIPPIVDMALEKKVKGKELIDIVWECFQVDILSWEIHMNISRLLEDVPKNPIFASFHPSWRLRSEQMISLACTSMASLYLFFRFTELYREWKKR